MSLIIAGVSMATMAILALKEYLHNASNKAFFDNYKRALYISAAISAGLCLLFALFSSLMFNFASLSDANYPEWLVNALKSDRKNMLVSDAWRSFLFIILATGLLWAYLKNMLTPQYLVALIGILILVDMWTVDKRFLNDDDFVAKKQAKNFEMTEADKLILQDKDPDYRVFNMTVSPFNDASTSWFHKSIGGYSGIKMQRYQDMIDRHFVASSMNMNVINMLNTRYFIVPTDKGPQVQRNSKAMGNAWFVDTLTWVDGPNAEIDALTHFNPETTAFVDKIWQDKVTFSLSTEHDSLAKIELTDYKNPGNLIYASSSTQPKLAIFSEVYYKTWKAYIDGQEAPLIRANYILRALPIPAGQHTIEFKCVDEIYLKWAKMSLWFSLFVGIVLTGLTGLLIYRNWEKVGIIKQ
jgi:uncharacterized membrane protein YfhO